MRLIILFTLLLNSYAVLANVIINGTRVIYPENKKETIVQLINNGDDPALVQSWIDDGDINSTPETANVPFLLSPPVVKVLGHAGQQLRLQKLPGSLPDDRESVFYLNVLDIPPTPDNLQGQNTMQLAIKTRIKLFYRPTSIMPKIKDSLSSLEMVPESKGVRFSNQSPFYITISNLKDNNERNLLEESVMVSPFSNALVSTKASIKSGQKYILVYVDDLGAYTDLPITAK